MLSRSQRLNLRHQPEFFSAAQRYHSRYFTVFFQPAETWQVACVVPKKIARLAVTRHLLKRRTLGVVAQLEKTPNLAVVLVAKSNLRDASPSEITTDLVKFIKLYV